MPVLELALWAVKQQNDPSRNSRSIRDMDPDWGWTRKVIADLIGMGLGSNEVEPPLEARESIWAILLNLVEDPDPTPDYEVTFGGTNMNPPTLALNTIRPMAIRGVIFYALWISRGIGRDVFSMNIVPEARTVLEEHLDTDLEPSLAVRSVYGQFSPWLKHLDQAWFCSVRSRIFDSDPDKLELWRAAWDTYVTFCVAFDDMLPILSSEYRHAIDLAKLSTAKVGSRDPEAFLGSHLLAYFGRKQIHLHSNSLLDYYLQQVDPATQKQGLVKLGSSMLNYPESTKEEYSQRFIELWEYLVQRATAKEKEERTELLAFGWWFAAGVFPEDWSISTLLKVLRLTSSIELVPLVIKRLATLSANYPGESLTALQLLVTQMVNEHDFYLQEEITVILRSALSSDVREEAESFIHRLGAFGISWVGELLRSDTKSGESA